MNKQDRKDVQGLDSRMKDMEIMQNETSEQLYEIRTNHLEHLWNKVKLLNLKINTALGGLVFIAIMIAILGCMIAFWKGG